MYKSALYAAELSCQHPRLMQQHSFVVGLSNLVIFIFQFQSLQED